MLFIHDDHIAWRGESVARSAMPLFSTSANVRRDKTRAVAGVDMIDRFCLENSARTEKVIEITGALS